MITQESLKLEGGPIGCAIAALGAAVAAAVLVGVLACLAYVVALGAHAGWNAGG